MSTCLPTALDKFSFDSGKGDFRLVFFMYKSKNGVPIQKNKQGNQISTVSMKQAENCGVSALTAVLFWNESKSYLLNMTSQQLRSFLKVMLMICIYQRFDKLNETTKGVYSCRHLLH